MRYSLLIILFAIILFRSQVYASSSTTSLLLEVTSASTSPTPTATPSQSPTVSPSSSPTQQSKPSAPKRLILLNKSPATTEKEDTPPTVDLEETDQTTGYGVRLKVEDMWKRPVEGAKVALYSKVQVATTNKEGIAEFKNVEPGEHKVVISYGSYEGELVLNVTEEINEFVVDASILKIPIYNSSLNYRIMVIAILVLVLLAVLAKYRKLK